MILANVVTSSIAAKSSRTSVPLQNLLPLKEVGWSQWPVQYATYILKFTFDDTRNRDTQHNKHTEQ